MATAAGNLKTAVAASPASCSYIAQAFDNLCGNIAPLFILYVGCSMKLSMPRFDQALAGGRRCQRSTVTGMAVPHGFPLRHRYR